MHILEEPQVITTIMEVHTIPKVSKGIHKDMVQLEIIPKVSKGTLMGMVDIPPQLKHPQVLIKGQAHTQHPPGLMLHNHKLKSKRSQAWRSC
jgi:hypothetical protein